MPAMGLISVLSVAGHIGLPLAKNNRRGHCAHERCGTGCALSRDAVLAFFPPRAPVLIQGVSMLAGHKAPLYALDPPAPCLAINIPVFIDFRVRRIDPIRTSGRETRGSKPQEWPERTTALVELRFIAPRAQLK
jgi:hypothetical protein